MIFRKIILLSIILLSVNISNAYDYTIILLSPTNEQTEVDPSGIILNWQTSPNVTSSNNLKYVIKVMSIDESEPIPTSLDYYCSSCMNVIDNIESFQSELGSYIFNANPCNKYVWQITLIEDIPASLDGDGNPIPASQQILGQSVVYSFLVSCNIGQRLGSITNQYLTFPLEYTSYVYGLPTSSTSIYFKFESEYNKQSISYIIFDESHKQIYPESGKTILPNTLSKGVNYEEINLSSAPITKGKTYFLEVYNQKDIMKSLKFRIEQ